MKKIKVYGISLIGKDGKVKLTFTYTDKETFLRRLEKEHNTNKKFPDIAMKIVTYKGKMNPFKIK
jgi:hypothetical protein